MPGIPPSLASPAAAVGGSGVPVLLALLSVLALVLVLGHRSANLGTRATLIFAAATGLYGLLRALSISALSASSASSMPYHLAAPILTLWGVPLQELVGWTVALGLSSYFADRMLRRGGQSSDPFRTALLAALSMAALCLAVETAAVVGGWWSWSLAHSRRNLLVFPAVALLDWAFVAFDFFLPFELWRRRAPLAQRLASLLLFPLHFAGHAFVTKPPGPLPLSAFDVAHVALGAAIIAAAAASRGESPWPPLAEEKRSFWPLASTLVLLTTTTAQLFARGELRALWTGLPLLSLALWTALARREPEVRTRTLGPRNAALLFGILLLLGLGLLAPGARRSRDFELHLRRAAHYLAAGDLAAAEIDLERARQLKPRHSETLLLLGWAELLQGNRQAARRHFEASLAERPGSVEAQRFLDLLDRREASTAGQRQD